MKQRYMILLFIMVIFSLIYFFYSWPIVNKKIHKIKVYDKAIKKDQEKLNSAKVLNDQLKDVSKVILNTITTHRSFSTDEINSFVKRLGDLADKYQIPVYVQTPTKISNQKNIVEQGYSMEIKCTYVQLGKFLSDLESFDNISTIKTLQINPIKQNTKNAVIPKETHYKVNLELSVFKVIKES